MPFSVVLCQEGEPQEEEEKEESEPACFHIFRWALILMGLGMLGCVLVIMFQLVVDWASGTAGGPVGVAATTGGTAVTPVTRCSDCDFSCMRFFYFLQGDLPGV